MNHQIPGIVVVGELNPYGVDPRYALYDEPKQASGYRLRTLVMGLRRTTYFRLKKVNLCTGIWSAKAAREAAHALLVEHANQTDDTLILLGRKVVGAFFCGPDGLDPRDTPQPFTRSFCRYSVVGGSTTERERENLVILPHPSGLNRSWGEPGAFERARALLREACPGVPWGEA